MLQIVAPKSLFDAIVVGSGAMRVVLLEAGRKITPRNFTERRQASRDYKGFFPNSLENHGDNEKRLWPDGRGQSAAMLEAAVERKLGQPLLPVARCGKSICDRWRVPVIERLPESHPHYDGNPGARLRVHLS